ncbi:MAG: hypothetical protein OXE17_02955 [Chloroflexi bacterium]|nr:hypothetical protein [Chloroflexota bacterium]
MTTGRRNSRYPSREERHAAEQKDADSVASAAEASGESAGSPGTRSRVAKGKTPTTFHLWDETRFALHTAEWELGMNLSEIGEAAIREYLEGQGIAVAAPGTGASRRRRRAG